MEKQNPNFLSGSAAQMANANPANPAPKENPERRRISMAIPSLKLQVPEIPGYVCRWMRGTPQRIEQALNAGYTFVERGELVVNETGVANDSAGDGNTDLGNRVSRPTGDDDSRLYLMKISKELWEEDQRAVDERHEAIAGQLRGEGLPVESGQDGSNRYGRAENRNIFQPRRQ